MRINSQFHKALQEKFLSVFGGHLVLVEYPSKKQKKRNLSTRINSQFHKALGTNFLVHLVGTSCLGISLHDKKKEEKSYAYYFGFRETLHL
jgi:hypothetical protein